MTQLVLNADLDRCTGCRSCVAACKEERDVPLGTSFIRVSQVGPEGGFPDVNMYFLPLACQQCRQPSCAAACPDDAIVREPDGVVTVSAERCAGCGLCVDDCPYGAIVLDTARGLARKCDLCAPLRASGHAAACVAACPAKALTVVDADAAVPAGTELRAGAGAGSRPSFALEPSLGTDPSARFILSRQDWRDRM